MTETAPDQRTGRALAKIDRQKKWCWAGIIGAFAYEAGVNPFVPFGPLVLRTTPGWNLYLGDVPTLAFAAVGLLSLALLLRANRQARELRASLPADPRGG